VLEMPPAIHEIIAYTDLLEVRGEVRAWPPRRILDVLNGEQTPYLTVEQASIIPLSQWGKGQPATVESIVLNKSEIILVWLVRETTVQHPSQQPCTRCRAECWSTQALSSPREAYTRSAKAH